MHSTYHLNSTQPLSRRYGQARHKKPHKEALWSPSYFAVSAGVRKKEVLKDYIRNQEKPATEEGACIPFFWSVLFYLVFILPAFFAESALRA
ncbi:transposase [Microcoleus sp. B4-C5]